jgi:hypothetical protein
MNAYMPEDASVASTATALLTEGGKEKVKAKKDNNKFIDYYVIALKHIKLLRLLTKANVVVQTDVK